MKELKTFTIAVLLTISSLSDSNGQEESAFSHYEDSLTSLAFNLGTDSIEQNRIQTVQKLIPYLVEALKQPNSFYYPFDSVRGISFEYAPDSAFRIITFQLKMDDGSNRYYGAIQINTGSELKLIPLFDASDTLDFHCNKILGASNWYGGVYYNIIMHKVDDQKYYTLFGFDANDFWSNKKFIEILTFEDGQPVFGAPIIDVTDSLGNTTIYNRFFIEFKHDTRVSLNYFSDRDLIVYDHLKPYMKKYDGLYFTYIPDGSYEGFEWEDGSWHWVKKVFHFSIGHRDNPPVPNPVLDGEDQKIYEPRSSKSEK